jgi:hypothetical protein
MVLAIIKAIIDAGAALATSRTLLNQSKSAIYNNASALHCDES